MFPGERTARDVFPSRPPGWWPIPILVVLAAVFFAGILFSGEPLLPSPFPDLTDKFLPMRAWTARQLLSGTLPHWNPHIFCGMPFRTETAVYYLPNAIFLFLSPGRSLALSIASHLALSGVFFYLFIRLIGVSRFSAFASALVYMLWAQQVLRVHAGHLPITLSVAWIPLLFFFVERYLRQGRRRDIAWGALVFAGQIFADNSQIVFYTAGLAIFYTLLRSFYISRETGRPAAALGRAGGVLVFLVLGLGLAAVQLLSEVELARHSVRSLGSYTFASSFSFPPENLLTFLVPGLMGDGITFPYWGRYYFWEAVAYIGVLPLLAALVAATRFRNRYCLIFAVSALLTLVVALGKYTPLYPLLFRLLPGFGLLRGQGKALILTGFFLTGLAAFGIEEILFARPGRYRRSFRNLLILAAGTAVLVTVISLVGLPGSFWRDHILSRSAALEREINLPPDLENAGAVRETLLGAKRSVERFSALFLAAALICFARRTGRLGRRPAAALMLAVLLVDLWSFGSPYIIPTRADSAAWPEEVTDLVQKDGKNSRVFTSGGISSGPGLADGISSIAGHHENRLLRYMELLHYSQGGDPGDLIPGRLVFDHLRFSPIFNLLSARYLLLPPPVKVNPESFPCLAESGRVRVYLNRESLPRCYIVHRAVLVRDKEAILALLDSGGFDRRMTVILEDAAAPFLPAAVAPAGDGAEITAASANRVEVAAHLSAPGYLVISDTFYPAWVAAVNGKPAEIYRANYVQRAVYLPPGEHTVEFVYSPPLFRIGAAVSLVSLVLAILLLARRSGGRRPEGKPCFKRGNVE